MRLGQFTSDETDGVWAGVTLEDTDTVVRLSEAGAAAGVAIPDTTRALLDEWHWQEKVDLVVSYADETGVGVYDAATLERAAPITDPEKVVAVGLNYGEHAGEGDFDVPDEPVLFAKFPQSLVGPGAAVEWDPELTGAVDYEGELVVVIGERARNVSEDEAWDYIAGYTVGNDVSARDLQNADDQWVRGKSLDTFGPLGPDLITADEVDDPHDLDIWTEVNGERLQDSNTEHLIFGIDEIVAFCSRAFTLNPGDVIYTGTPDGVGFFRDPQVLLGDGDTMTVGVEGVGELTNHCVEQ